MIADILGKAVICIDFCLATRLYDGFYTEGRREQIIAMRDAMEQMANTIESHLTPEEKEAAVRIAMQQRPPALLTLADVVGEEEAAAMHQAYDQATRTKLN